MESSSPSANSSDPHPHRWAEVMGTVIALLTLTLPIFVIASYSSNSVDVTQQTTYYLSSMSQKTSKRSHSPKLPLAIGNVQQSQLKSSLVKGD